MTVRWSIEQGKKKGRKPLPDQQTFLASMPILDGGGFELARAYARLSTCRQMSIGGLGPIPADVVWEWLDRAGVRNPIIRRHVEDVITAIDTLTLRRTKKPAEGDTKERPKSPARRRRRE